ncbi:MAG: hypothetical protein DYG89_35000 [Caldilinea sp. CFX5]|nr:hypothetical protein [Caldilinea sp. CFX5]
MKHRTLWMMVGLLLVSLCLTACGGGASTAAAAEKEKTYTLDKLEGSDFNLVTLSEKAAQRLVLETGKVSEEAATDGQRLVVPYSALIYGLHGENWVYVTPQPLSFHRAEVKVDYIEGDKVFLLEGPDVGTEIAITAVAELYGVDTGVKK